MPRKRFKPRNDVHSDLAELLFDEVTEETRHQAKLINYSGMYGVTRRGGKLV